MTTSNTFHSLFSWNGGLVSLTVMQMMIPRMYDLRDNSLYPFNLFDLFSCFSVIPYTGYMAGSILSPWPKRTTLIIKGGWSAKSIETRDSITQHNTVIQMGSTVRILSSLVAVTHFETYLITL